MKIGFNISYSLTLTEVITVVKQDIQKHDYAHSLQTMKLPKDFTAGKSADKSR
jgi:hypothetical protein